MNIVKKVLDLKINEIEYKAVFDMQSVIKFKELSGKSFLSSVQKLSEMDEEIILYFMASTIREKENSRPLGEKIFEFDTLGLLFNLTEDITKLILNSMPEAQGNREKK